MILIGQYDSPFVRRVAISLHVLELPFTRNPLSVFSDAEEMRRLNPLGRVPALVLDGGEVLIDSVAILDHLDEVVGPARALIPGHGEARRAALRTIAIACGVGDKSVALSYERLLRPETTRYEPYLARCLVQIDAALRHLDSTIDQRAVAGERPAQTAITTVAMLGYLRLRHPDTVPAGRYPALDRLVDAAERLAPFAATRPTGGETLPSAPKG